MSVQLFTISDTSPAAQSTVVGSAVRGLAEWDSFRIDATLTGATGGVLDVYLQRQLAANVWADWLHFTQVTAAAAAATVTAFATGGALAADVVSLVAVGVGNDASPGVALAAGKFIGGHPGTAVRAVYVAGASTSAGAAQVIRITAWRKLT